ncbi:MAG: hypothetical protein BAJATHORv1_10591 [Candidatus Thorarchaeota archaeon]|nr:MAG: hypothetical protein BAJATHORv1_10591 [Candidatus Thorarchaeota archaeon]
MKVAVISNLVTSDITKNQERMLRLAQDAVNMDAEMVIFPEAAATGLVINGKAGHDYPLTESIPGPRNKEWAIFAEEFGVYFEAGLLELDEQVIYDSAVLFNPSGELILHHRSNDRGWFGDDFNPSIYQIGSEIPVADTSFGKVAMLICGELWQPEIYNQFKERDVDVLIYPFTKSISSSTDIVSAWVKEFPKYLERWRSTRLPVLASNIYEPDERKPAIGGAWYMDKYGNLRKSSPIRQESILIVDLK